MGRTWIAWLLYPFVVSSTGCEHEDCTEPFTTEGDFVMCCGMPGTDLDEFRSRYDITDLTLTIDGDHAVFESHHGDGSVIRVTYRVTDPSE